MSQSIRILHLSDLHLSEEQSFDQSIILRALWKDLERFRNEGPAIDLVFFTGDLIAKGNYNPANVALVRSAFIEPLLEASKLSSDRLFLVPGNHDIDLKTRSSYLEPIFASLTSEASIQSYLVDSQIEPLRTGLERYNSLVESLNLAPSLNSNTLYHAYKTKIADTSIGICAINSAWKASGKPNDVDCGRLAIGRYQVDELASKIADCDLKLGLFHHPTNWLAPFDNVSVQRLIALHFDGIFYGHNHDGDGLAIAGSAGTYFASNAACLYQHRDYANGYSVVDCELDKEEWRVSAREYFEQRQEFDAATRFAPQGTKRFKVERKGKSIQAKLPSSEFTMAVNEAIDSHLMSTIVSDVAPKSLRGIFVEPPLSHVSQRQISAERKGSGKPLYVAWKDAISSTAAVIFVGAKESGKTTLLHRICCQGGEINVIGFPAFAVYVDMSNDVTTRAKLLNAIVQFGGGVYPRQYYIDLMREGLVAICFDNWDTEDENQGAVLTEFSREFSKCKYFFATREQLESSLSSTTIPTLGLKTEVIYLHSFGRKETRALAKRWFGELDGSASDSVDEILSLLGRLNIPRTPFLISAMLWIKESHVAFSPVNKAAILDAFIDGVLEKLSESKERRGLDSTIKRHFLAAFAEHLASLNVRRITIGELDQFTVDYFKKRALNSASGPFIAEMMNRGILTDIGGYCGFKFNCVRAFFLASRLRESSALLDTALAAETFMLFSEELDYFTGSTRDRADVLTKGMELLEKLHTEARLDIDLSYFEDVSLSDSPFNQERKEEVTEKILGSRLQGDKREDWLDRIDNNSGSRTIISRDETVAVQVTDPVRRFLSCLQITSAILRNSELVDDPALKLRCYETLTQYWCEVMTAVVIAVDFMEEPRELEALSSLLPLDNPALVRYFLKVLVPTVIMSMALESLGTGKLQLIIEQVIESPGKAVQHLLSTFLYVDLRLPKRVEFLEALLENHKGNRFMAELIFFKIASIYGFSKLSEREEGEMRKLVASSMDIILSAKSHVEKNKLKNRVLADFEKRRLSQGVKRLSGGA